MNSVTPKPGDLIEIFRGEYQHWAVYIGDGIVVHLVTSGSGSSSSTGSNGDQEGYVLKEPLKLVVGDDKWKINNSLDKTYKVRPIGEIVKEADSMVNKSVTYNVVTNNCEHFATKLRYGQAVSQQVRKVVTTGVAVGVGSAVSRPVGGLGSLAFTGSLYSSSKR